MNILLIETATSICSSAIVTDGNIVACRATDKPNAHSTMLSVFIEEMLDETSLTPRDLHAVGVSVGPGSYTGLRIGVSTAKGFCYALGIPLVAVPTPLSMAALYYRQHPAYHGMVCPMIDARRMECYTMMVEKENDLVVARDTQADIIEMGCFDEWLDRGEVMFIGDGADKTRDILGIHPNARYDTSFRIDAEGMTDIVLQRLQHGITDDVAYYEPFYLKNFVAKKSVVHGLRD